MSPQSIPCSARSHLDPLEPEVTRDGGFEDRNRAQEATGGGPAGPGFFSSRSVCCPVLGAERGQFQRGCWGQGVARGPGAVEESQAGVGTRLPLLGAVVSGSAQGGKVEAPPHGPPQASASPYASGPQLTSPGGPLTLPAEAQMPCSLPSAAVRDLTQASPWRGPRRCPQKLGLGFSPHSAHPPRRKAEIWGSGGHPGPSGLG